MNHTIRLALDRSVRNYDSDGRLHVSVATLTSACVSPYLGSEIPGVEAFGVRSDAVYPLLRAPDELALAVKTFQSQPVLTEHVPHSAADHQHDLVVGSTGTDATFQNPDLKCSLVIWDQTAIDAIEDGSARSLSCGYYYEVDPTPGVFNGARYWGVMRSIRCNHVALVAEPRVPGAMVGDANPFKKGTTEMPHFTKLLQFLKSNLDPDDFETAKGMLNADESDVDALDEPPPFPGRPRVGGGMDPIRQGMDRNVVRQIQAIREAEEHVRPYAGNVLGMDSVASVYGRALKQIGYNDAAAVRDPRALKIIFDSVKGRSQSRSPTRSLGVSAAHVASFKELFPGAVKLKNVI